MRRFSLLMLALLLTAVPCAAQEAKPLRRIAFGSCAHQGKPQPIWEAVVAARPELFLFLGDNIYGDSEDLAVLKQKYDQLAALPGYRTLLKTCPVLATWDDHDYGVNDGGADFPKKKETQQLFLDFFGVPKDSPRRTQEGVYSAAVFGPPGKRVQVILLDTRYFRSPLKKRRVGLGEGPNVASDDPNATILGPAQWQWLGEQLKVPAELRLLVSSIQVVPEDHGWEKWMNFPRERERLYKLLRERKAEGVVILSGDRHLAELSQMSAGIGYPLFDLTSSGLNRGAPRWRPLEVNRHRVATMTYGNNFGLVAIDWDSADPMLSLQIRDEKGDIRIQEKVPLSLLRAGALKDKAAAAPVRLDGKPLSAARIKEKLKQEVTVEITVVATGASAKAGLVFLNSAERANADNFTVVLDRHAQEGLKKQGIARPAAHFKGRAVRVTGVLTLFRDRPQIVVSDASRLRVIGD